MFEEHECPARSKECLERWRHAKDDSEYLGHSRASLPGCGSIALFARHGQQEGLAVLSPAQRRIPLWFCVQTKSGREAAVVKTVSRSVSSEGMTVGEIGTYFPRIRARMAVGGHLRTVVKPLFPGYFFARFIWESASRFVASRTNVTGIVHFGECPAMVPEEVIAELRNCGMQTGEDEMFDPLRGLEPGQRVVIQSGPFRGMEGELVMHLGDRKRVALLMDHLQSQARLTIGRDQLRPVF